jgi:hypothetical protein
MYRYDNIDREMLADRASEFRGPFKVGLCGIRFGERDICFHRVVEQYGVFKHDTDLLAQLLQFEFANIYAVKKNVATICVVKAQEQSRHS